MSVQRPLAAAQIPPERLGPARTARLDEGERSLYHWILGSFARGEPPDATALATQAERLRIYLSVALASLASDDLVHTGTDVAITVAYPFSGRPTAHRVQLDVHEVHAMCAIDALGMAPMFGRPIRVESSDPVSGDTVRVELAPDGDASWTPQEAVVVSGSSCDGAAFNGCCHVLNFFSARENAEQYLSARADVRGIVISIREAIEAGRCVFGDALSEIR